MTPKWPSPQPLPTTPLQGGVIALKYDDYVAARTRAAHVPPAVQKLYDTFGAYKVKPKRDSVGVVWGNRAFWWSHKGYYRPGKDVFRRPLHQLIWEASNKKGVPVGMEVVFADGDRHNFQAANLVLRSKADIGARNCVYAAAAKSRSDARAKGWEREGKRRTSLLLDRFNSGRRTLAAHLKNGGKS